MKRICLLCLFMTYVVSRSFGGYVSIGWWESTTPAITARTFRNISTGIIKQEVKNAKLGSKTNIEIDDYKFTITNSKHGKFTSTIYSLFHEVKYNINNGSKVDMGIVVLPNDNVLVTADITSTNIDGYYKHEDKVVFPYGIPVVVEGATVPIRSTTGAQIAFILDCEKGYKVKNAFYIPEYTDIVSSTNGRIYFLWGREHSFVGSIIMGYTEIECFNIDGTFLWKKKFKNDEYCTALQETTNHLYMVGRYSDKYGFYSILNAKTGECVKDYRDTKYPHDMFYSWKGYTLDFKDEGIGYDLFNNANIAGTIRYDIIKEDSGIGPIVTEIIKKNRREEEIKKDADKFYLKENVEQLVREYELGVAARNEGKDGTEYFQKAEEAIAYIKDNLEKKGGSLYDSNKLVAHYARIEVMLKKYEEASKLISIVINKVDPETNSEVEDLDALLNCYLLNCAIIYEKTRDESKLNEYNDKMKRTAKKLLEIDPNNVTAKTIIEMFN